MFNYEILRLLYQLKRLPYKKPTNMLSSLTSKAHLPLLTLKYMYNVHMLKKKYAHDIFHTINFENLK